MLFKGVGILLIVIHNYLHVIPPFDLENEHDFEQKNAITLIDLLLSFNPHNILGALFGFFGHYGVQIFIFFSAYGLAIEFSKRTDGSFHFVLRRLKKIYFLLAFAILLAIAYDLVHANIRPEFWVTNTILLATTVSSFWWETFIGTFSGPFWFFPLIIQLYLLFPILDTAVVRLHRTSKYLPLLLSIGIVYILYFSLEGRLVAVVAGKPLHFTLFGNILGHLPEVALGITMAKLHPTRLKPSLVVLSVLVFIASQLHQSLFPLSFLSVTILLLSTISSLGRLLNQSFREVLFYIGKISMILFIANGFLRGSRLFGTELAIRQERLLFYLIVLVIISHFLYCLYSYLMRKLKI